MTIVLSALLLVCIVGFLVFIDLKDRRFAKEREEHAKQVQTLLNRLANPQIQLPVEGLKSTGKHHLPFDDDKAWHEWQETIKPMEPMING